jgi:hypothetical protein
MKNCKGPCLEHCNSRNNFVYLVLGFFLGIIVTTFLIKYFLKKQLEKITFNKIEKIKDEYLEKVRKFLSNE